jgi:hypothetical protein
LIVAGVHLLSVALCEPANKKTALAGTLARGEADTFKSTAARYAGTPYFLAPRIRNNLVPQSGQTPCTAGRPFFILTSCGFAISFFALHFTQYASAMMFALLWRFPRRKIPANLSGGKGMRQAAKAEGRGLEDRLFFARGLCYSSERDGIVLDRESGKPRS